MLKSQLPAALVATAPRATKTARPRRTNVRRRGRTAVIWALVCFGLLQLAYYPASDYWPRIRDVEYGDKLANLREQLADKPKNQPCVVMFGSSLTGWAFNPSELETVRPGIPGQPVVFNFAMNSGGVFIELVCLRRLLATGIRPDLVIVETHPQFLFRAFNTVPGEHYWQVWRYQRQDLELLRRYDPKYPEFRPEWKQFQEFPWYTQRHEFQNYVVPRWGRRIGQTDALWTANDRNGWEFIPSAIAHGDKHTRQQIIDSIRPRIQGLSQRLRTEEVFKQMYREIIETCQREGIAVVMVRMPEASYALEEYSPALRQELAEFYDEIEQKYNVPFIDASAWVDDDGFPDGFHLRPSGAAVFMKRLERELLGAFLADRSLPAVKPH